jgi:hypothetical protein
MARLTEFDGYAVIADAKPLHSEATPDYYMGIMDALIDDIGIVRVLEALRDASGAKADHLASNWQDARGAKAWNKAASVIDRCSANSSITAVDA